MLEILNTYAGCNQNNKMVAIKEKSIYYGSFNNIIKIENKKIVDVIYLENVINCIAHKNEMIIAGDIMGIGYIIKNDKVTNRFDLHSSIQDCVVLSDAKCAYCTINKIVIIDTDDNDTKVYSCSFIISSVTLLNDTTLCLGDILGNIYIYKLNEDSIELIAMKKAHLDRIKEITCMGDLFATCSQDYNIKIWKFNNEINNNNIMLLQTLNGHSDWVNSIYYSEKRLISASSDKTIRVWENSSSVEEENEKKINYNTVEIFGGTSGFFFAGMFDRRILGQYKTGGMDLFDINGEIEDEYIVSGHQDEICDLDWRSDMLLSTSLDKTARIFYDGKECIRAQIHGWPLTSGKFIPGKKMKFVSSGEETILRVFEGTNKFISNCTKLGYEQCEWMKETYVEDCILSELNLTPQIIDDSQSLPLTENSLSISVFNEIEKLYGHFFDIKNVSVNKKFIFSCNKGSSKPFSGLFVWDYSFKKLGYYKDHDLGILKIKATESHVGTVSRDKTMCLYVIEEFGLRLLKRFTDHSRQVWDCAISEKHIVSCSRDRKVIIYNLNDLRVFKSKLFDCEVTAVELLNNGLVVGFENGFICLLDFDLNVKYQEKVCNKKINVIKKNANNEIAIGGADGLLRIITYYN